MTDKERDTTREEMVAKAKEYLAKFNEFDQREVEYFAEDVATFALEQTAELRATVERLERQLAETKGIATEAIDLFSNVATKIGSEAVQGTAEGIARNMREQLAAMKGES